MYAWEKKTMGGKWMVGNGFKITGVRGRTGISGAEMQLLWIALPLMLIFCATVWLIQGSLPITAVWSENGMWDLREIDFSSTNVRFTGKVEYIPNALLTPEERCV